MNQEFQHTINEIQHQLSDIDVADVVILHASIFHSTSIILHIKGNKDIFLQCNYCQFFRGNTAIWKGVKLILESVAKPLGNPIHKRTESVLRLLESKNQYFIDCKNIQLITAEEANSWIPHSHTKIGMEYPPLHNHILEKWPKGRGSIVNSDFVTLRLRIDMQTNDQVIHFENTSNWYTPNKEDRLEIYIHQPCFLSISFVSWEISDNLILSNFESNMILQEENSNFEIEAKFITAQEVITGNKK